MLKRSKIVAITAILVTSGIIYGLYGLPFLLYSTSLTSPPCQNPVELRLQGNVLFMGDTHIQGPQDRERFADLREYLPKERVEALVIVGDLLESPNAFPELGWEDAARVAALDILSLRNLNITIYWILGAPVHDPQNVSFTIQEGPTHIQTLGKCALLIIDGSRVLVLHGDQAFDGALGFAISALIGPLTLEGGWRKSASMSSDIWVIMAHTHVPGIDHNAKLANTGGWKEIPIFNPPVRTAVLVKNSIITLVKVPSQ